VITVNAQADSAPIMSALILAQRHKDLDLILLGARVLRAQIALLEHAVHQVHVNRVVDPLFLSIMIALAILTMSALQAIALTAMFAQIPAQFYKQLPTSMVVLAHKILIAFH